MSEHKHNPTAIKAKNGEIPPKPPTPSKRERERQLLGLVAEWLFERLSKTEQKGN